MAESSDFEMFSAPAASEKKEINQEAFNEDMRRTQKAMKDLKQEEDQAKQNDNNLAQIIVQFLGQEGNTDLFLLISRAVAQNIPSELIIAILSLIDQRSYEEVKNFLISGKEEKSRPTMEHKTSTFDSINPEQKKNIDHWVQNIAQVAYKKPHRTLETVLIKKAQSREISAIATQLSAFILRRFFDYYKINIEFSVLREFCETLFVNLMKNLEILVGNQRHLSSSGNSGKQ